MATIKPELKTILDRYGINSRDTTQVWDCRGTLVLYHKAFEIIAAKEGIVFDPPKIIRGEKDEAVILVVGQMGERIEWSFGEAVIGQNYQVSGKQAAYPYAMAEKRAKDRVVSKLAGLAQYVYSEDEAEDFKTGERKPVDDESTSKAPTQTQTARKPAPGKFELLFPNGEIMAKFDTPDEWFHGLREAITQPGAMVKGLWERNEPIASTLASEYPDVQWAGKTGAKLAPYDMLAVKVRQLLAGIAA